MRGKLALFGGFGPVFLIGGLIAGVIAVANASTVSAYEHATVCPSGAALDADCLQTVDGSVSGVTEVGGKDAHYALYVQSAPARSMSPSGPTTRCSAMQLMATRLR